MTNSKNFVQKKKLLIYIVLKLQKPPKLLFLNLAGLTLKTA